MKTPDKFGVILNVWISLVINVVLSILLPIIAMGFIDATIFLKGFAIAFTVSTIFIFVVPVVKAGDRFAALLGAKPFTIPAQMLSTVVVALSLGTLMTLLMTAVNAGVGPHFVAAWLKCYWKALLAVYMSALAGIWTGIPLTKKICG
ncbi:MAG: DUF2798 domain-containing protein [Synergistaceae bacterium]|jgi:hypothetical protein|nr:DUF2798 domain-containing protein [Synergistaceae bacterium]